jgi:hypothetical protein
MADTGTIDLHAAGSLEAALGNVARAGAAAGGNRVAAASI